MSVDKYLPDPCWKPEAEPISDIFLQAEEELISPPVGTKLVCFPKLNFITGGFRPYEFTILCGSTGSGKTTLCANLSRDLLAQDVPQFVASVETGHTDYVKRMISAEADEDWNTGEAIPSYKITNFNDRHLHNFTKKNLWLSLYDNRTTVEKLMADMAWMVKHHKTKIAIIDNLNFFLEVTSANNAVIEMDRVVHELIIFCKQIPIHVIMIMHPRKTENGRIESEYDIKGSSTAVQEAHNVFLFNRPHPDMLKSGAAIDTDRELTISKMRRRGKLVKRKLMFRSGNGVSYREGEVF